MIAAFQPKPALRSHVLQGARAPVVPAPAAIPDHHSPPQPPQQRAVPPASSKGKGCLVTGMGFWPNMLRIIKPIVLLTLQFLKDDLS